jgi:hypothetical protein
MEERPELEAEMLPDAEEKAEDESSFEVYKEIAQPLNFWQSLRRFFLPNWEERRENERQRLRDLSVAIERYPEAAVNYLLRGELHLKLRQWVLAEEDLSEALRLAEAQYEQDRWGLSAQAIADRARRGLEEILRYS